MDDVLDDVVRIARRCERAERQFETDPVKRIYDSLRTAADSLSACSSNSWLGYHAFVYTDGFRRPHSGIMFDPQWGLQDGYSTHTNGLWRIYEYEEVLDEIQRRAGVDDISPINKAADNAKDIFEECKLELTPTLDAIVDQTNDPVIRNLREKAEKLSSHLSRVDFAKAQAPRSFLTNDHLAVSQGQKVPCHLSFTYWLVERRSFGSQVGELAKIARHAERYLRAKLKMKGKTVAKTEGKIFIGHGRSAEWRNLKDYLRDRLHLDVDEFNMEAAAGLTTKERLEQMLDDAVFAFLVMTAEDEQPDGQKRARENVVHEAGLFQGRLGFRRAILLVENGCEEFSNIHGLTQIRFEAGNMKAAFDEIRHVLEREEIVK